MYINVYSVHACEYIQTRLQATNTLTGNDIIIIRRRLRGVAEKLLHCVVRKFLCNCFKLDLARDAHARTHTPTHIIYIYTCTYIYMCVV